MTTICATFGKIGQLFIFTSGHIVRDTASNEKLSLASFLRKRGLGIKAPFTATKFGVKNVGVG